MANAQRRSHTLTNNWPFTFGQRGLLSLKSDLNNIQGSDCNVSKLQMRYYWLQYGLVQNDSVADVRLQLECMA